MSLSMYVCVYVCLTSCFFMFSLSLPVSVLASIFIIFLLYENLAIYLPFCNRHTDCNHIQKNLLGYSTLLEEK